MSRKNDEKKNLVHKGLTLLELKSVLLSLKKLFYYIVKSFVLGLIYYHLLGVLALAISFLYIYIHLKSVAKLLQQWK